VVQGPDGTPDENQLIMEKINECMAADGNVTFGLAVDEKLGNKVKVTIVASGMDDIEAVDARFPSDSHGQGRGMPVTVDVRSPHYAARPAIHDQIDPFANLRPRANTSQFNTGAAQAGPQPMSASGMEGESELDPTPAYLRVGSDGRSFSTFGKIDGR